MMLDQRPDEPIGATLDRAVDAGHLSAHDAEQIETFSEFLRYAGPAPRWVRGDDHLQRPTEAQLRWLAAFVRTEKGGQFFFGTFDRADHDAYAAKLERHAWRYR